MTCKLILLFYKITLYLQYLAMHNKNLLENYSFFAIFDNTFVLILFTSDEKNET